MRGMQGSRASPLSSACGPVLAVDLDGTLVRTDLLRRAALVLLGRQPWSLFYFVVWLLRGRAYLKEKIAERVDLDVAALPYRDEVVAFLREQKAAGRRLILATAANHKYAYQVAEHLAIFDGVIASNASQNYKGQAKANALIAVCPDGVFDYLGDSAADMPVWGKARRALVVAPKLRLLQAVARLGEVDRVFGDR